MLVLLRLLLHDHITGVGIGFLVVCGLLVLLKDFTFLDAIVKEHLNTGTDGYVIVSPILKWRLVE